MTTGIIIKSSYSQLPDGKLKSNLGDLLRCGVLLECIGGDFLWLTDPRGRGLLKWFLPEEKIILLDNDYIIEASPDRVIYNFDNFLSDERLPLRLSGGWRGFIPDNAGGMNPENALIASTQPYQKQTDNISFQQAAVEGMGFVWNEQDYPSSMIEAVNRFDIGLNYHVHPEWTSKQWPMEYWQELYNVLSENFAVSWQEGMDDYEQYLRWIASCKAIITPDTLGVHLASAFRKKVIVIAGPTECREYPYDRVTFIKPEPRECMPCCLPVCQTGEDCLAEVKVEVVDKAVTSFFFG